MSRLSNELMQMMFYNSKGQILDTANIKGCIERFLFEKVRTEDSLFMSTLRHNVANNIANAVAAGMSDLHGRIRRAADVNEKNELIDRQVLIITEAINHQLITARLGPEGVMLEKLLELE